MLEAKNVLTIGIDYRVVRGGVAAVENVYSTFYKPFNHVTTVVDNGKVVKLFIFFEAIFIFLGWMLFHKEIEIVHVHGASGLSFWRKSIFINMAKLFKKKIVLHMHGGGFADFSKDHKKSVRNTLDKCDAVIALSEYWKDFFEKEFDYHKVTIVKNVIAKPIFCKQDRKQFTLLFLGLIGSNKGIYDLLDVIDTHQEEFRGDFILKVGGNGEVEKLQELIAKKGISDIVNYEGWVSGDKKADLLNGADVYVLPSYKEGLPISILEAMSYSLPVISTRVGGIPEIIMNGKNGFLINPGDKEALYESIIKLKNSEELRIRMGEISKPIVQEHLPIYVESQLKQLYNSL